MSDVKIVVVIYKNIPKNIADYYSYYGHYQDRATFKNKFLRKFVGLYLVNVMGGFLVPKNFVPVLNSFGEKVSEKYFNKNSSILDVGFEKGEFLSYLSAGGYKGLDDIDLFIDDEYS